MHVLILKQLDFNNWAIFTVKGGLVSGVRQFKDKRLAKEWALAFISNCRDVKLEVESF